MSEKVQNKAENELSETEEVYYPHLKITKEKFPKLYATRKFLNKKDSYFGAFLPKTALRIWLYRLNKIFKLRSCRLEIDGNFPQPCQMFFTKRCVAPCVASLCSETDYADYVMALKLFLSNQRKDFEKFVVGKIDFFADNFEFEKAAIWRDIWHDSQTLLNDKKLEISLANAVDTFEATDEGEKIIIHLITTRGRKFLGNREFAFEKTADDSAEKALESVLQNFYKNHLPREIRTNIDFPSRKDLEKTFRQKFTHFTKIVVLKSESNKTAKMRLIRSKVESDLEKINIQPTLAEIGERLKELFNLSKTPQKIEAFDVAHISNQDFIGANAVWENGELKRENYRYWKTDAENEPQAMSHAVSRRLQEKNPPDVILIDGGMSQLNAVLREIDTKFAKKIGFVCAVKPSGRHNEISHFLLSDATRIEFSNGEKSFEILRNLRDEAHRTANELHRQYRDNKYIFAVKENFQSENEIPLVLVRFDEPNGAAEDLQPIKSNL